MSSESPHASQADRQPPTRRHGPRHFWFPLVVVLAVAAWWAWQTSRANYQTLYHVIVLVLGAMLISLWFGEYGPFRRRLRWTIVGSGWLVAALLWCVFRPIYNGDMGIVAWRLRFGSDADQLLEEADANNWVDDWTTTPTDYPRFLGNGPWPEVSGVRLETDWQTHPPQETWRREIGAGWSAFAVVGPYAVTQEQRGDEELVTCYRVADGSLVWAHSDPVRFDPGASGGLGGPGPRATPTIVDEKIFTQGATGLVNCLDAHSGDVLWSRDTVAETGAELPTWGKSGSPLVIDDKVIVSVGAPAGETASAAGSGSHKRKFHSSLIAYDVESGRQRWAAGRRQASYASPIVATIAGERQIVCINEHNVTAHRVKDGRVLWEYPWPGDQDGTATASQPVPVGGDRLFLSKGYGVGASLLHITHDEGGQWHARPKWDPPVRPVMKTKFCNVALRDGYVYGLDDVLLQCVELDTGRVMWKKRRKPEFGHGQLLLVGEVILVLSERGELALVEASPTNYREVASFQALDPANVTWNTPAFAPPFLLIRNAREAACYRLPVKPQ